MKLAIMQPYFFPYIGYFQLINAVDEFILFDVVQYINGGWINRNRILSPNLNDGWTYIVVPLKKHNHTTRISDIKINYSSEWTETIKGKLTYYKKIRAPYYTETIKIINDIFKFKYESITDLNYQILSSILDYLDIHTKIKKCSDLNFDFTNVESPGDWAFEISKQMQANSYYNPIGGQELFDRNKFIDAGIEIKFVKSNVVIYRQSRRDFVPWLSIIDVIMFNSIEKIKEMLNEYELI